jgi:hypothetical protein
MRRAAPALLVALLAAPAAGDSTLQAAVAGATGYTDNATSVPSGEASQRQSDVFASVDPSLTLLIDQPRLVATLSVEGSFRRFWSATEADSKSARAAGSLGWEATPTVHLAWDLFGLVGEQSSFEQIGVLGPVPQGGGTYAQAATGGSLFKDFTATWRGSTTLRLTLFEPLDDASAQTRSVTVEGGVSAQLSFKRDAAAVTVNTAVSSVDARTTTTTTMAVPAQLSETVTLQLSWLHELGTFWGLTAEGGASLVFTESGTTAAPLAKLTLGYRRELTDLELAVAENVASNTLIGLTSLRTDATLRAITRFGDSINLKALVGAAHDEAIGSSLTSNSIRSEAGITYKPRENFELDLVHTFLYQKPTEPSLLVPELLRNTVTLTFRCYWPDKRPATFAFMQQNLRVRQSEEWDQTEAQRRGGRP